MTIDALQGRVAIVTGAGRGIGRAIALAWAAAGAAVCCASRTTAEIDGTVHAIKTEGGRALAVGTDVTQPTSVQRMVELTEETFGGLDIVLVNAGIGGTRQPVASSDPDAWRATLEVNLFGAYLCARACIPALVRRGGGKIITLGSGLGHRSAPVLSDYACAKAGLWMLTRVLAQELVPCGISVNELVPGPTITDMLRGSNDALEHLLSTNADEWVKQPEDIVPLALFLATQPATGPSGQSFSLMRRDM